MDGHLQTWYKLGIFNVDRTSKMATTTGQKLNIRLYEKLINIFFFTKATLIIPKFQDCHPKGLSRYRAKCEREQDSSSLL